MNRTLDRLDQTMALFLNALNALAAFVLRGFKYLSAGAVVAVAALTASLVLGGCTSEKEGRPGEMSMQLVLSEDIKSLDPAVAYDSVSWTIVPAIYETLYQYAYLSDPYELEPLLAADMPKFSKDGLTVTVPIRKDVNFADDAAFPEGKGRALRAQDFVFGWKRLALNSIKSPGYWIFEGKIKGMDEFKKTLNDLPKDKRMEYLKTAEIEGLKALDDHTLQIQLTKKYPQLLYVMAMPFTSPVAVEASDKHADDSGAIRDKPVGTGPYKLESWSGSHRLVLVRNPTFHPDFYPKTGAEKFKNQGLLADAGKPLPFVDRITYTIIKEDQPAWLKFMNQEIDVMGIPKDNFASAMSSNLDLSPDMKKKGIKLSIDSGNTFFYVEFNMKDEVVGKSKYLRQALSSAIDREKYIELFMNNRGSKMDSAVPPGIPGRPEKARIKYDYDVEKAKELLAKAGYPGGKGLPPLKMDMRGSDSVTRQMGEFFASQFKAIGVDLKVIYNTFPAFLEKMKQGNLQVFMGGWGLDYPDAENVFQLLYGPNSAPGPNGANFNHPRMNKLYERMAVMLPSKERDQLIAEMDELMQEEAPWAPLYYRSTYRLYQPWVENARGTDLINGTQKYIRINQDIKKRALQQ